MERFHLSVSAAISQGWAVAKKHLMSLAGIVLVIYLVSYLFSFFSGPSLEFWQKYTQAIMNNDIRTIERMAQTIERTPTDYILEVVSAVVTMILMAGFYSVVMRLVRGTLHKTSLSAYKMPVGVYAKYVAVSVLCAVATLLAGMLCLLPGIYLNARLSMAPFYVIDNHDSGIFEAIKASWQMTKGNFWSVLALQVSNFFIMLLGTCCCCVGFFLAFPIINANMAVAFYQLLPNYIPDAEYETL